MKHPPGSSSQAIQILRLLDSRYHCLWQRAEPLFQEQPQHGAGFLDLTTGQTAGQTTG
jgi:hypothetical protein